MIRKLDLEQRALAVAPEVSLRWIDDSKLGNEQNSTLASLCSYSCCSWGPSSSSLGLTSKPSHDCARDERHSTGGRGGRTLRATSGEPQKRGH
jgi:hypothetical protein